MTIPPLPPKEPINTTSNTPLAHETSSSRASFESFMSDEADIFMTIHDESEFVAIEPPPLIKTTLKNYNNQESMESEKQISIDPISFKSPPPNMRQASFRLVSPPPSSTPLSDSPSDSNMIQLPSPPPKLKFVNTNSLTAAGSSNSSSPEYSTLKSNNNNKVWKNESSSSGSNLSRPRSSVDDTQLVIEERNMRRNRSIRGRSSNGTAPAPPTADDFELWLEKPSEMERKYNNHHSFPINNNEEKARHFQSGGSKIRWSSKKAGSRKNSRHGFPPTDDKFKCGKLCLFLPKGGKGRPVRSASASVALSTASSADGSYSNSSSLAAAASSKKRITADLNDYQGVGSMSRRLQSISRRVSLEKFECGSWSSASFLDDDCEIESANLFFDLPLEMIRCSVSDMQSPVTAAFLFDKDDQDAKLSNV